MNNLFIFLSIAFLLTIPASVEIFAQTEHEIKIPSGASDPGAPFFWSEKNTGVTTGEITVYPGDSITWSNGDSAFHTITSVSASSIETGDFKEDGLFDSGFFTAGKSYTRQFNDQGDFYYYCTLHPYMNGVVHVTTNPGSVQTIDGVAKTLIFTVSGDTDNEQLIIILPPELIENPNTAWVDGEMTDFEIAETNTGTKLIIPILPHSKEIKIMGTHVIPEFGSIAMMILVISIISIMILTQKSKIKI
jgi:predicted secreted protein with PEFG-CTERM motif